ncbi:hypothetical protein [Roseomonas harenae]|uniref:hypothetical protein n=1 Tax=Muricoccus harenae TaxID=2692566 RepID=UPI0013311C52|nr:hypothetical protein [Roseomonas harenae]
MSRAFWNHLPVLRSAAQQQAFDQRQKLRLTITGAIRLALLAAMPAEAPPHTCGPAEPPAWHCAEDPPADGGCGMAPERLLAALGPGRCLLPASPEPPAHREGGQGLRKIPFRPAARRDGEARLGGEV